MKYLSIAALPIMLILLSSGCTHTDVSNNLSDKNSAPKKEFSKWDVAKSFSVDDYHLILGILNDDNNLYIRVATTDSSLQSSFTRSGCTIWIDTESGKNKSFGIHYPTGKQSDKTGQPTGPGASRELDEESAENFKSLEIVFDRGKNIKTLSISEAKNMGIETDIQNKSGFLLYDLKIPFSEIYKLDSDISILLQTISIGIEIEEIIPMMNEEKGNDKPQIGGGPSGSGQGGMGGSGGGSMGGKKGGMGGGSKPGSNVNSQKRPQKTNESLEKWFTVNIS